MSPNKGFVNVTDIFLMSNEKKNQLPSKHFVYFNKHLV
jgi:hypothetical protein